MKPRKRAQESHARLSACISSRREVSGVLPSAGVQSFLYQRQVNVHGLEKSCWRTWSFIVHPAAAKQFLSRKRRDTGAKHPMNTVKTNIKLIFKSLSFPPVLSRLQQLCKGCIHPRRWEPRAPSPSQSVETPLMTGFG